MSKKGIVIIFAVTSIFLFVNGVANFGYENRSKFLQIGILLLCFLLICMGAYKLINYLAEEKVFVVLYCIKSKMRIAETVSVAILLLAAVVTRILAAIFVKAPTQEKQFLYEDVLFPAQKVMKDILEPFQGISVGAVEGYEVFNILISIISTVLVYLIVKNMYGRSGALTGLLICALWPSHIFGITYDSEKYFCTMLFLATIYFFLMFRRANCWPIFSGLAGVTLGVLAYMQTSMYVLFVLFIASAFVKGEEGRGRTFGENFVKRIPAVAVSVVVAIFVINGVNGSVASKLQISNTKLTGTNGYGLLTGMNAESIGNENEQDYEFLMENYEEGNNPKDAQNVCGMAAWQRFSENKAESFNLMLKKAQYIFGCGANLEMRKDMSKSGFIYLEDAYYLLILLAAGIFSIELLMRAQKGNINFIVVTSILITISGAIYMFEETIQMQFGVLLAICGSAIVSIIYRRGLQFEITNNELGEEFQEEKAVN